MADDPDQPKKPLGSTGELSGDFEPEEAALLRQFFLEEAHDHLEGIASALMSLERLGDQPAGKLDGEAKQLVDEVLRKTHTLKGSASTVGQKRVSEAAHLLEDSFVRARAGKLPVARASIDTWLSASDLLRETVEKQGDEASDVIARLRTLLAALDAPPESAEAVRERRKAEGAAVAAAFGLRSSGPPPPPAPTPSEAELLALLGPDEGPPEGFDEAANHEVTAITALPPLGDPDEDDPVAALDLDHVQGPSPMERHQHPGLTLRVEVARVDELMDAASELVFDHTRIHRRAQEIRGAIQELDEVSAELGAAFADVRAFAPSGQDVVIGRLGELESAAIGAVAQLDRAARALVEDAEALRRTATSLQQGLTRVRMMSVRWLFARLQRPLRDLARDEGKRVLLTSKGEDTELDKTVVEQITDPLIHLVRNAITHGIEDQATRLASGKPAAGNVHIEARQEGDSVYLEVSDDGAGIDPARIRRALVAARRMSEAQAATTPNDQILAAIFEPGFSTRSEANQAAGRGVGLDVVRQNILRVGGDIVVGSNPGEGTRFTIRLPLTTAISQALLFKSGGQVYAVPHVHVADTIAIARTQGRPPAEIDWREQRLAVVALDHILGLPQPPDEPRAPAVVVAFGERRLAVVCEKLIGLREIVVKGLGPLLAPLKLFPAQWDPKLGIHVT